ncbi:hypothetical protein U1Q18_010174 [Sarracenia purpurea var. burkii]
MGPVLGSPISLYIIWYGHWDPRHSATIRDFLHSLSSPAPFPSVADWWRSVRLYTDQTGSNVTASVTLAGEFYDSGYSHGGYLTRLAVQSVIADAVDLLPRGLPGSDLLRRSSPGFLQDGADGMISVIAHELAEVSSNPLVNAWYAGDDPAAPDEIADLCVGVYGSGGGGGYVGKVYKDSWGNGFNVNGVRGRKFLVQWVWNLVKRRCFGPNAMD